MPRTLRLQYAGALYQLMSRRDRRERVFLDGVDRQDFVKALAEACQKTGWQAHAYCLMTNHYHLAVETPEPNSVAGMAWLQRACTNRLNHRRRLLGHVFSGRYKAQPVEGTGHGYPRTACDSAHLNPARAGMRKAEERLLSYPRSSLGGYLATPDHRPSWIRVDRLPGEHGIQDDSAAGRQRFEQLMERRRQEETGPEALRSLQRGWLASKTYNNGSVNGPSYSYTPAGRLASRLWARGVTTTYTTNTAGDLLSISYSDGMTPGVTNAYDRLGRLRTVSQGTNATTLAYNDANLCLSEACTAGMLANLSVTNGYDQDLRRTNLAALNGSTALLQDSFGYDAASRLQTVADNGRNSATISYLPNSPLVSYITYATNGGTSMTTTKQYDYLNRLAQISSAPSGSSPVAFNYAYNNANQRTGVTNTDGSYWAYGYDSIGQATAGKKYWSDTTPVAGEQFQYLFDDIGNRKTTDAGGDQSGLNLRHASYTTDSTGLNQYVNRDVPGFVQSIGSANSNATVTIWTANNAYAPTVRKGEFFRGEPAVTNTAAVWLSLTNLAVLHSGTTDIVSRASGGVFVPKTQEQFTYDADGNLKTDGRWIYAWDAENRLVQVATNTVVGPPLVISFAYDWKGRRIQKQVSVNGAVTNKTTFLYDGWNLIAKLNATNNAALQSYLWGLDLSGSIQGAGGVGGLLEISDLYNGVHFAAYDGNGNVAALVSAVGGTNSAQYEYGPFGELLRATGPMAKANPFRFSTKFQDDETDFVYYGYRYYAASTGRWLSRDPIAEPGFQLAARPAKAASDVEREKDDAALAELGRTVPGLSSVVDRMRKEARDKIEKPESGNWYVFVKNDSIDNSDALGLKIWIHICWLHQLCRPKVAAVVSVTYAPVADKNLQRCCDAANRLYSAIDFPGPWDVASAEVYFQTCCSGWAK